MTDTVEITDPNASKTPEQAIGLLGKNADQLEQVSLNLGKAFAYLSGSAKMELRGYKVEKFNSYDYVIKHHGRTSGETSQHYSSLTDKATAIADSELVQLSEDVGKIGELVHFVHLDRKELTRNDAAILAHLPQKLAEAKAVFESVVQSNSASEGQKNDLIQFRRDIKFLEKLSEEVGDAGAVLVEHNKQLVDRQSELLTEEDIGRDRSERFAKGVALLTESAENATRYNPSYRDRIKNRKPLEVVSDTAETPPESPRR